MNPISDEQFSHDYEKFVLQNPNVNQVDMFHRPKTPFSLEKNEKTKKEGKKKSGDSDADDEEEADDEGNKKPWSPFSR